MFPDDDLEERIAAVNEGTLEFLPATDAEKVFESHNVITIDADSLNSGWVKLLQCYRNLDPVGKIEIVYQYRQNECLRIESHENIGLAEVRGNSLVLEDVGHNARLCLSANIRNFYPTSATEFVLRNGPYHRKFFDGYFPFHLKLEIRYPQQLISFSGISPEQQDGFHVQQQDGQLLIDTLFEGVLSTEIQFRRQ